MIKRPLRFCMITTFYPPHNFGGDGIVVERLATELADRGHHVEVIHCLDAFLALSPSASPAIDEPARHANVVVHALKSWAGRLSPLLTHQTGHPVLKAAKIKRILQAGRFDVVHFHNISLIGPSVIGYTDAIRLFTPHEHWLVCPLTVLWKFNRAPCSHKNCTLCTLHAGRPPQLWRHTRLLDRAMKQIDAVIAPSHFTWDKHQAMGAPPVTRVEYLTHFLRLPQLDTGESPWPRPFFLYVGRLEKMKGVQVLIDAFRHLHHSDLLICGDGTYERELRRLAAGLHHVHFLGRLAYPQLQRFYRHAVAALLPSIGYEVFGVVILEALAQETPLIVHGIGAPPEVIRRMGGGLVYRDEAGLLQAIETLRSQPELRRDLGRRGHDALVATSTPDVHLAKYFELIERIASSKGRTFAPPARQSQSE